MIRYYLILLYDFSDCSTTIIGTGGLCSENMTLCQHNYAIMPPKYATHYTQVEVHYAVLCRTMPPTVFYINCYVCV